MSIKVALFDLDGTLTDGSYVAGFENDVMAKPHSSRTFLYRSFYTRDFHGICMLNKAGIKVGIVTSARLDACIYSQFTRCGVFSFCDVFTGVQDKDLVVQKEYVNNDVGWDNIAFIGDDTNDLSLLMNVGMAGCPADAEDQVIQFVRSREDGLVTSRDGGRGAVREFINYILGV